MRYLTFPSAAFGLRLLFAAAFAATSLVVFSPRAHAQAAPAPAQTEPLTVRTASGEHRFQVEVARTDEQRARGLMFRRYMPPDRGMLFDFKVEQPVMMWMRNTYIPLDMIFISRDGRVINVAENTEPMSERTIASAAPAFAVLEVNAGVSRKIGLKPGDQISHPLFKR
jgi:uncharacterized protein